MSNTYRKGGSMHPMHLKNMAETLRKKGQGRDKVLAHINPEEAEFLEEYTGGDINPYTGLPQFGLFGKKKRKFGLFGPSHDRHGRPRTETIFEQGRRHHPILGAVADVASAALGTALGGPAGGIAASALKGGLDSGMRGVPMGALKGVAYNAIAPSVGEFFGADPSGMLGQAMGLNSPSLLSQLGIQSGSQMGGGLGLFGNMGYQGALDSMGSLFGKGSALQKGVQQIDKAESSPTMMGKLFESVSKNPMDALLLGTTVGGLLSAKSKTPPEEQTMQQIAQNTRPVFWEPPSRRPKPLNRKQVKHEPEVYTNYLNARRLGQEAIPPAVYEDANPEIEYYAHGGRVGQAHYFDGYSGGQTDDVPVDLPEGSYVMDATTVSLMGDGNSRNGEMKVKKELIGPFTKHSSDEAYMNPYKSGGKVIKARVSNGEMIITPEEVAAIGNGSNEKGVKKLDKLRNNLRKHKGVKKFLPPKSKPLSSYMR